MQIYKWYETLLLHYWPLLQAKGVTEVNIRILSNLSKRRNTWLSDTALKLHKYWSSKAGR